MEESQLLFFDTFSHDSYEELNLDLVQFPNPVFLFEIRVIPLGARVQADFPGGYRLGATNPSSFKLEFFANDLSKRCACTFVDVGCLNYSQNVEIQLLLKNRIPTDGLVLRGYYGAVTLAVYGVVAKTKELTPPPQPQSDTSPQKPQDIPVHDKWEPNSEFKPTSELNPDQSAERPNYAQYETDVSGTYGNTPPVSYSSKKDKRIKGRIPNVIYEEDKDDERFRRWFAPGDNRFPKHEEGYLPDGYRLPNSSYTPASWGKTPCPNVDITLQETDHYDHEHNIHSHSKNRNKDEKDDKEYSNRSWESDHYRERNKGSISPRDRDRDNARDKTRSGYLDRGSRIHGKKRPMTPPSTSPPFYSHASPQTPPDGDKVTGPRTPKEEEPLEMYEEHSPITHRFLTPLHNLSEGELHDEENTDDDGYEEIVSEEEIMSPEEEKVIDMSDIDYDFADESWHFMSSFSPYSCELTPCQHFVDPTLTKFEQHDPTLTQTGNEKLLEILHNFKNSEHTERWIEALESLDMPSMAAGLLSMDSKESYNDAVDTLIDWVVEGLDFELALKQPQTPFKVRHIKAGIRLASLLFQTDVHIMEKLLEKEIPRLLLQMFDQSYMVLPIKLLILRAIDSVAFTKKGLDFILTKQLCFEPQITFEFSVKPSEKPNQNFSATKTIYQKLLEIFMSNQMTRVVAALASLTNKLGFYESLLHFQKISENLLKKTIGEDLAVPFEGLPSEISQEQLEWQENVQIIITCLNGITNAYHTASRKMSQQKRLLPAKNLLELPKLYTDPVPSLLRMLKETNILETLHSLISSPILVNHSGLMVAIRNFFMELLHTQNGMLFLISSHEVVNRIQKALFLNVEESRDDNPEDSIAIQLGMLIVYRLQTLLYLDTLFSINSKGNEEQELTDAISTLHLMYTMIFTAIGRLSIIEVLSMNDNLNAILPLVQTLGEKEADKKTAKTICTGYVLQFIMLVVEHSERISVLMNFSQVLLELGNQENLGKSRSLAQWVTPATKIENYNHEAISDLCDICKNHMENASALSPELITAVRILKHICIPENENVKELKYMHAIIQLFSCGGLTYFVTILQNICDTFLKSPKQSASLIGTEGVMVLYLIKPILCLMKSMLNYVISCQATKFQDLTAIPVLLQVEALMMIIPSNLFAYNLVEMIQKEILEMLLSFTQTGHLQEETDESLSKSVWTRVVQFILKFTLETPSHYSTGVSLLSELLPLPLPLQSSEPLSSGEVSLAVNHRKLWSAHLHPLSGEIQEIISSLAISSHPHLQMVFRRVCIQLADLAAPTSLIVVRGIIDSLIETLELNLPKDNAENSSVQITQPCSYTVMRTLNLIAYLVSYAVFKIPLLQVLKASTKVDEKYSDALSALLSILNVSSPKLHHIQAQEWLVSMLQSMCDPDIGLVTVENGAPVNEALANCLPCKEHMAPICTSLIQHVGSEMNYGSILQALRTMVMLAEHDYGFYHLKLSLEQHPESLQALFFHLGSSFKKNGGDYLVVISTALEFLHLMVKGYEEGAQTGRSMVLSPSDLAHLLSDAQENSEAPKPGNFSCLTQLEELMTEFSSEEAEELVVESLLENLSGIITLLNEGVLNKEEKLECKEPILPQCESLSSQFSFRTVFLVAEEAHEESIQLPIPPIPIEMEQDQEKINTDLIEMAEKFISEDFDLKSSLENICNIKTDRVNKVKKDKGLSGNVKQKYMGNTGGGNTKRTFIAPMRGRGFSRATTHVTRANDPFRSRPPNTSRPPSMHVDDFVALESHHNGSSNQPQQKRQDGRGRGRGERTGRFFTPPAPYSRDTNNTRIDTSSKHGTSRISNSTWGSRTGSGIHRNFGSAPSTRYDSAFSSIEPRLSGRVSQQLYELLPSSESVSRFPRSIRVGSSLTPHVQGHWQETRNKAQSQKFISNASQVHGRRDLNSRHERSYTR